MFFKALFAFFLTAVVFTACTPNNVTVDNSLGKYFDSAGVQGSFGLFDNGQGSFIIYNLPRFKDSAFAAGATYDIPKALIALQTGVLADTSAVLPAISKDTLKKWIDSLHYGNMNPDAPKITSDEQLGLIKRLYFDQLPFFNRPQKLVRSMLPMENNSNFRLVYKSGEGVRENGHRVGWLMGWEEENTHPYFFVVNMETADSTKDLSAAGLQIVKGILRPMGFFNGKK